MLEPKPCPANNPDCDAQVYSAGEFVFCPKCKQPNPNFSRATAVEHRSSVSTKQQPVVDVASGTVKWS